jgi:hypothetical protein
MEPSDVWQYAIDPSTIKFHDAHRATKTVPALPAPIFEHNKSPLTLTVTACRIDWPVEGDLYAAAPPEREKVTCLDKEKTIVLSPYGVGCSTEVSQFADEMMVIGDPIED